MANFKHLEDCAVSTVMNIRSLDCKDTEDITLTKSSGKTTLRLLTVLKAFERFTIDRRTLKF